MAKKDRGRPQKTGSVHKERRPSGRPVVTDTGVSMPSAASLFRFCFLDAKSSGLIDRGTSWLKSLVGARDDDAVRQIKSARSAQEVIELAPSATGLAESVWQKRVRQFGPEAVPWISQRLALLHEARGKNRRDIVQERLIGALRWQGETGARVLLERFDDLDDYGRSLACVALGLLKERAAADRLWQFFEETVGNRRETHFVGALWGLIDLGDERVGRTLAVLLVQGRAFYELYGFLSLAGTAEAVIPLLAQLVGKSEVSKHAAMALVSIAHRIGKEALMAELFKVEVQQESGPDRESIAEKFLAVPERRAREYFGWFYRGLTLGDLARVFSPGTGRADR